MTSNATDAAMAARLQSLTEALETRASQQAAVAAFGQEALALDDLDSILGQAVTVVTRTLDLPICGVLERRPDGSSLVYRASIGWRHVRTGHTECESADDTQAGYTVRRGEAVTIPDMVVEWRFRRMPQSREHDVASGVTVAIPGVRLPYGVLEAFDVRVRDFSQDDVHFLQAIAHIIGTAVRRHRAEGDSRRGQRLEAVGRLASAVAHDFNNLLTAIAGYGDLLRSSLEGDDQRLADVDEILKAANRAAGLTRQLLAFSREQVLQPRIVKLNEIVTGIEKMLRRLMSANIELEVPLERNLGLIKADPGQIEQVLLNLCVNARDAMPAGGRLTIQTANVDASSFESRELSLRAAASYVMLAVSDTGTGMDAQTRARIFEPFFTTKSPDRGTGLGLATVYGIVKQSGGEIDVNSEPGHGTTFKIFFPRFDTAGGEDNVSRATSPPIVGTETILMADDEEPIRMLTRRMLEAAGYTVITAKDGADAEQVESAFDGPIHLLVTDIMMPRLNGVDLAARLRARRPKMRVLFLSGQSESGARHKILLQPSTRYLQKPFAKESLLQKVREVLDDDESDV